MSNQIITKIKFINKSKENFILFLESLRNKLFSEINKILLNNSKSKIQVILLIKINRKTGDYCFRKLKTKYKNITVKNELNNIFNDYIKCNLHIKLKHLTKTVKYLKNVEIINLHLHEINNKKCNIRHLCVNFEKMKIF